MLPRENRLSKKRDFEESKQKGRKFQSSLFGLLVLPNQIQISRFGFIVSNKISKKATLRNRTKRHLRESVSRLIKRIKIGYNVIFLAKKEILKKDQAEINLETEKIFRQAGLINDQ